MKFFPLFFILTLLLFIGSLTTYAAPSDDFIITIQTDNPGTSASNEFTIQTTGGGYDYNVDCDDTNPGINISVFGQSSNYTCSYPVVGTYTIRITDNVGDNTGFPRIFFASGGDKDKILTIKQWGAFIWTSFEESFMGASNLTIAP
jgi:hypothetical protein